VEHRAPAVGRRVAEAEELQTGCGEHRVERRPEEVGDDERGHRREDLADDDVRPPLAADPDLHALDAVVGHRKGKAVVALVGHSPWIEELAAMLLTGTPKGIAVDFPKSGVLAVEAESVSARAGMLRFFLRPRMV